jgi:hypothetical protein
LSTIGGYQNLYTQPGGGLSNSLLENINQSFCGRNYTCEIKHGIYEAVMAEIVSGMLNENSHEYTSGEAVHLTIKSLILDILTNVFTIVVPRVTNVSIVA